MRRISEEYWAIIEENMIEFNKGLHLDSIANKRFGQFYHWYYHPIYDFFAPSKFIGYSGTNHENYDGWGDGGQTQKFLLNYFEWVPDFDMYYEKLLAFANKYHRKISKKTYEGTGGIYIPNQEVMSRFINKQYSLISEDIHQYESEFEEFSVIEEGKPQKRWLNKYERNPSIKMQALRIHGTRCMACQMSFEEKYGDLGKGFIEIHHLNPLSSSKQAHYVDPRNDIAVVCSNCHRMIHKRNPPLSIDEIKEVIGRLMRE